MSQPKSKNINSHFSIFILMFLIYLFLHLLHSNGMIIDFYLFLTMSTVFLLYKVIFRLFFKIIINKITIL
jgi:hypothetical protein